MYGDKVGQNFGLYRKQYDAHCLSQLNENDIDGYEPIYRLLMDMHSFRTTVATLLINAGVPQAHAEEITGHKSKARQTAFENYDKGRTLVILKEAIERLRLSLSFDQRLTKMNFQNLFAMDGILPQRSPWRRGARLVVARNSC